MEKTFQYHQQIFAGLELEIYNDLLKKDKIFLQCIGKLVQILATKWQRLVGDLPIKNTLYLRIRFFCSNQAFLGPKAKNCDFF